MNISYIYLPVLKIEWILEDFWSPEKNLSNHNYVHPPAAKKTGFYGPIGQRKNKIKYVRALIIWM